KEIQNAPHEAPIESTALTPSPAQDESNSPSEQNPSGRTGPRKRFWDGLLSRPKARNTRHANIATGEVGWIAAGSGVRGLPLSYVIGQDEGRVELYIDRGTNQTETNKHIFDQLHRQKKKIERDFGGELSWQRLNDKRACRIAYALTVGGYKSD